jgi:hypothetical protein
MLARWFNRDRWWHWRRWIAAVSVLLLIRAALPQILRRVTIAQASQFLRAQVDVGDVDLALYRGGIALKDVAVRSAVPATHDADKPPPLIAWKRLDLEVRWLPLFRKTIRLQHVILDSPRVAVDRLADGRLNLLALLPPSAKTPVTAEPTPAVAPTPVSGGQWGYGLDRLVIRDGGLRFRDLTLKDSEPIELNLEHVEVTDIALDQGVYGTPSKLHLAVAFDQGTLDLDARVTLRNDGMAVAANLNAWGLPLRQTRLYIPSVGWSAFDGSLDAALTYRAESGWQNEVTGTIALRDLSVRVPGLEQPALAWRNLTVRIDPLDLIAQRVAVTDVELSGASLVVRTRGGILLPLLAASLRDSAPQPTSATPVAAAPAETPAPGTPQPATSATVTPETETLPTATPTATPTASPPSATETTPTATLGAEPAPAQAAEKSEPWSWSVASVRVDDSTVHRLAGEAPLDIGVELTASDLAGDADYPAHVGLALTVGDGSLNVDGALRLHFPGFAGTLRTANLSLPEILRSTTALPSDLLQTGRLSTALTVEAGMAVPDGVAIAPRDVRARGHVTLADAQLKPPATTPLAIAVRSVDLELKDLHVAGALVGGSAKAAGPGTGSLAAGDLHLDGTLSLAEPSVASPDGSGLSAGARAIELTLADVTAAGVLPPATGAPTRGDLRGGVHLALADAHAAPAGSQGFAVDAQSVDLGITDLSVPGLLARAPAPAGDVRFGEGRLSLVQFKLTSPDPKAFLIGTRSFDLTLANLTAGGVLPVAPGATARGDLQAAVHLAVADVHAAAESQGFSMDTQSIDLGVGDLSAQGLLTAAPAAAPGVHLRDGQLSVAQVKLGSPGVSMDTQSIDLAIGDLSAQGLLAAAPTVAPDVHLGNAQLSLAQFKLAGTDPKAFLVGARSVELPIKELSLPGGPEQPIRVVVGDVRVAGPTAQVTRTSDGLVLPQFAAAASSEPAAVRPPTPAPQAPPRLVDVVLNSFRLTDGQVTALDRSVKPFFKGGLAPLNIELRGVRWPTLMVDKIRVTATGPEQGTLDVYGALKPDEGWFQVYGEKLGLRLYNPYATSFSAYSIGSGTLSLVTKGSRKNERYYVSNSVTLHDLSLQGGAGESLFQQQFGVPLEMALALMRDFNGNIVLDIPIEADSQGAKIDVLSVVAGALRHAIVNALTSPLKLVGAVFGGKAGEVAAPAPIGFRPGRAELDPSGSRQIDQLAAFMRDRPGIGVTLETSVTNTDVRWLREQSLLHAWENAGVLGALRGLTQRSARERVRHALEVRAKDEPAELSAEDAAALDAWLDEQPAIPAERLHALADERLERTEVALEEGHGLDATRVKRREPAADVTDGAPAVRVELGPMEREPQVRNSKSETRNKFEAANPNDQDG